MVQEDEREVMKMQDFLKRRLNPFLLISTVAVLTILAGLSVTYQDVLSEKVSTNQQLQEDLEEKKSTITTLEGRVSNLSESLSSTEQDLATTVNETRRQDKLIDDLKSEISSLKSEIEGLEETVSDQKANISSLQEEVDAKETEISEMENDLTIICGDVPDANMTEDAEDLCERWE